MSMPQPQAKFDAPTAPTKGSDQIKVVQHSMLFYWWPVWAVGFLLFLVTWVGGERMAVVRGDSILKRTGDKSFQIDVKEVPPLNKRGEELGPDQSMSIADAKTPFGLFM